MKQFDSSTLPLQHSLQERNNEEKLLETILGKEFTPNAFASNHYHRRAVNCDYLVCLAVLLHFIIVHCYIESDLQGHKNSIIWLDICTFWGFLTIGLQIIRFRITNQLLENLHHDPESFYRLVFLILTIVIMPYPFLSSCSIQYNNPSSPGQLLSFKVNYILSVLFCIKFVPPATAIISMSQYMKPRAYRLGRMTGVNPDLLPALRSLFRERPFSFIIIVFVVSVALFSYSFRVAEHHFISQDMMTAYSNMAWMTVITMTTIGFGDISPVTPLGRFVASMCVTWGVIIVAIMVAVLTNTLSLNNQETQSLIILKKLRNKQEVKEAAGLYLRQSLWRAWKNYKHRQRRQQSIAERRAKSTFQTLRKRQGQKVKEDLQLSLFTEMSREFERVSTNIDYLINNNLNMINYVSEELVFKGGFSIQKSQSDISDKEQ